MMFVFYGWLLFRAGSWHAIATLTTNLIDFTTPPWTASYSLNLAVLALPLSTMQAWQARTSDLLAPLTLPRWGRGAVEGALLMPIIIFWRTEKVSFIYFQF